MPPDTTIGRAGGGIGEGGGGGGGGVIDGADAAISLRSSRGEIGMGTGPFRRTRLPMTATLLSLTSGRSSIPTALQAAGETTPSCALSGARPWATTGWGAVGAPRDSAIRAATETFIERFNMASIPSVRSHRHDRLSFGLKCGGRS